MNLTIQSVWNSLVELKNDVIRHEIDLYRGKDNENLSIVARLALLEKDMDAIKEARKENRVWFMGILATIVATLILMHLKIF